MLKKKSKKLIAQLLQLLTSLFMPELLYMREKLAIRKLDLQYLFTPKVVKNFYYLNIIDPVICVYCIAKRS